MEKKVCENEEKIFEKRVFFFSVIVLGKGKKES